MTSVPYGPGAAHVKATTRTGPSIGIGRETVLTHPEVGAFSPNFATAATVGRETISEVSYKLLNLARIRGGKHSYGCRA